MNIFRFLLVPLLLFHFLAISSAARAGDPFACVDPDVRDAFLGVFQPDSRYTTSAPAYVDDFELPSSWKLIGTHSSSFHDQTVFKSDSPVREAHAKALATVEDAGWKSVSIGGPFGSGGFQNSATPRNAWLCSPDSDHVVSVSTSKRSGTTYVSFGSRAQKSTCSTEAQSLTTPFQRSYRQIPVMIIDDELASEVMPSGGGGGGDSYSLSAVLKGVTDRNALLDDLATQIGDQQWQPEGSWASALTSGSVWSLEPEPGSRVVGTLHAIAFSDGSLQLSFTVRSASPDSTGGGSWNVMQSGN